MLNLKWGHPDFMKPDLGTVVIGQSDMWSYAPDRGTLDLIHDIKDVSFWQSNHRHKHIILTNGATQATNALLRLHRGTVIEHNPLCFPFWTDMISKAGCMSSFKVSQNVVALGVARVTLVDSPANATGQINNLQPCDWWDAAYNSPIYANNMTPPPHKVMIGSLSKILGVPGLRIGWIATDDDNLADKLRRDILLENATLNHIGMLVAHEFIASIDMDRHAIRYKAVLDNHRQAFQALRAFSGEDVPDNGMFYTFEAELKQKQLLTERGILFHDFGSHIRLNMGIASNVVDEFLEKVRGI